jgi:hypothetical protein
MSLEKEASRRRRLSYSGALPHDVDVREPTGDIEEVRRALANHLVSECDVAVPGETGLGNHLASFARPALPRKWWKLVAPIPCRGADPVQVCGDPLIARRRRVEARIPTYRFARQRKEDRHVSDELAGSNGLVR